MCAKYRIRSYAKPAAANLCTARERIAFPLGKVARGGAARTVTDEGRPPAAGVLGAAVISEGSSVGLYPAAHRAVYFPLYYAIFFAISKFILQNLKIFFENPLTKLVL